MLVRIASILWPLCVMVKGQLMEGILTPSESALIAARSSEASL